MLWHGDPDLRAESGGDPASTFEFPPRNVEKLWTDQSKDVGFQTVLANQCGGESEPAARLNAGRSLKKGCWQQVYFVVNNKPPVVRIKQSEMAEAWGRGRLSLKFRLRVAAALTGFALPVSEYLVGGNGDRFDFLPLARILAHVIGRQGGFV